jgi:hypothetical protein
MLCPCECMIRVTPRGDAACRTCGSDWYGCDCPNVHRRNCPDRPVRFEPMIEALRLIGVTVSSTVGWHAHGFYAEAVDDLGPDEAYRQTVLHEIEARDDLAYQMATVGLVFSLGQDYPQAADPGWEARNFSLPADWTCPYCGADEVSANGTLACDACSHPAERWAIYLELIHTGEVKTYRPNAEIDAMIEAHQDAEFRAAFDF